MSEHMTPVMYSDESGYFTTNYKLQVLVDYGLNSENDKFIYDFSTPDLLFNRTNMSKLNSFLLTNNIDEDFEFNPEVERKNREWSILIGLIYAGGVWGVFTTAGGIASVSTVLSVLIGFGIAVVAFVVVASITYLFLSAIDNPNKPQQEGY